MQRGSKKLVRDEYYYGTVNRLNNIRDYQAGLASLMAERSDIEMRLDATKVSISKYAEKTASSSDGLTQPEAAAEQTLMLEKDLSEINREIDKLQTIVTCLELAMAAITTDERELIKLRCEERMGWNDIAANSRYSEPQVRRHFAFAVWRIRNIIFAHRTEENARYIFLR